MFEELGLNVARQPDNAANPRPDNRSGWLAGETPDVVEELLEARSRAAPSDDRAAGARSGTPRRSCATAPSARSRRARTARPTDGPGRLSRHATDAMSEIEERLEELRARSGLCRARCGWSAARRGRRVLLDGRPVLLLCSNNYLGLADHPRVREAAAEAAMRWGVGAGASRLVSGHDDDPPPPRGAPGGVRGQRGVPAVRLGLPREPRRDRRARRARRHGLLRRAQPRLDRRRLPAVARRGRRLPPPRPRAPAVEHAPPRRRDGRAAADRDRLGLLDGRRRRAAGRSSSSWRTRLRRAPGRRRGARDRHARPGRARRASPRPASRARSTSIVGTLGKALGSYGAYVCGEQEIVRYLLNTARSLIFSTAPAAAGGRRRARRARAAARSARTASSACARTRARCAARSPRRASRSPRATCTSCRCRRRRARRDAPVPGGARAGRLRPGDPPADGARGHLAPAPGRDGLAHGRASCAMAAEVLGDGGAQARAGSRRDRHAAAASSRAARAAEPHPSASRRRGIRVRRGRRAAAAPFDVEQPRPRRPPAPPSATASASAPFDGEREAPSRTRA